MDIENDTIGSILIILRVLIINKIKIINYVKKGNSRNYSFIATITCRLMKLTF